MVFTQCACKALLLGLTIAIAISCSVVLALGVAVKTVTNFLPDTIGICGPTSTALATLVATTCMIGLVGTCLENKTLLKIFGVLIFIMFVLQMALGIYTFKSMKHVRPNIAKSVESLALRSLARIKKGAMAQVDLVQKGMRCCGINGSHEFAQLRLEMPPSCCRTQTMNCDIEDAHKIGCTTAITIYVTRLLSVTGAILIISSLVEFITALVVLILILTRILRQ